MISDKSHINDDMERHIMFIFRKGGRWILGITKLNYTHTHIYITFPTLKILLDTGIVNWIQQHEHIHDCLTPERGKIQPPKTIKTEYMHGCNLQKEPVGVAAALERPTEKKKLYT
jgi:hypothetical protein